MAEPYLHGRGVVLVEKEGTYAADPTLVAADALEVSADKRVLSPKGNPLPRNALRPSAVPLLPDVPRCLRGSRHLASVLRSTPVSRPAADSEPYFSTAASTAPGAWYHTSTHSFAYSDTFADPPGLPCRTTTGTRTPSPTPGPDRYLY